MKEETKRFTFKINGVGDWLILRDGEFFALIKSDLMPAESVKAICQEMNEAARERRQQPREILTSYFWGAR